MIRRIIVDSICPLNEGLKKKYGICQVPLSVIVDGEEHRDDERLDREAILSQIEAGAKATTAAPSPNAFFEAGRGADECFFITSSQALSGAYNAAHLGSRFLENQGVRVHVFDSQSAGPAETSAAVFVAEQLAANLPFDQIVQETEAYINQLNNHALLVNLEGAMSSGRMPKIAAGILQALSLVVVLTNEEGKLKIKKISRHLKKTLRQASEYTLEKAQDLHRSRLFLSYVTQGEPFRAFLRAMEESGRFQEIVVLQESGVMTTYAGRDAILFTI